MTKPLSQSASDGLAHPLWHPLRQAIYYAALFYLFLLGIHTVGEGFQLLSREIVDRFFEATSNPFIGLMIGIIATSIIQSSSVTTSLVVGLVAAPEHPLPLAQAIPIVMGANFGTTVTNTVVALAHIGKKEEFHRAFAVSTCDDFFNFFAVLIILPIELVTGLLAKTATFLTASLAEVTATGFRSPIEPVLHFGFAPLNEIAKALSNSRQIQGSFLILLSGSLVFFALIHLVKALRQSAKTRVHTLITRALKQPALISMALGFGATALVQSSSITTSLLVPLAGAGFISLHQAFPIVLGANLGTTMTALLAALAGTGENASAGLAIALIHCLFNATGIAAIYPWKRIRTIPLWCSEKLADTGIRSAPTAIAYVLILFYGIPALFAILHQIRG